MTGLEIKSRIIAAGLKMYEVAAAYGLTETSFSRKLRGNFNDADTEKVLQAIESLQKNNQQ